MALLLNPEGAVENVADVDVAFLRERGWGEPTPDALAAYQQAEEARAREERNAGAGNAVLSFATRAAETMLPGANALASKYGRGLPAEDVKELWEERSGAATAGTVAGVALPLVATMGKSAPAQAARLTAPALFARAGAAAERAVAGKLGQGVAAKVGGMAVRGAAEGALYGAADVVSEASLGNQNYTAEALLANPGRIVADVGEAAVFNAALSGILAGGSKLVGAGLAKWSSKETKARFSEWLDDFEARENAKAAGATQSDIAKLNKNIAGGREGANELLQEGRDLGLVGTINSPSRTLERVAQVEEQAARQMETAVRETDNAALMADAMANKPKMVVEKGTGALVPKPIKMVVEKGSGKLVPANPAEFHEFTAARPITKLVERTRGLAGDLSKNYDTRGVANDLLARVDDWLGSRFANGAATTDDLWRLRQDLDKKIKWETKPEELSLRNALRDVRGFVSDEIKARMAPKELGMWNTGARKYQVAEWFRGFAEHLDARAKGNNLLSLTELMGGEGAAIAAAGSGVAGAGVAGAAGLLGTALLRRQSAGLLGTIARAARDHLEPKVQLIGALKKNNEALTKVINEDVRALVFSPGAALSAARATDESTRSAALEFGERALAVRSAARPEAMAARLADLTRDWHEHAPTTSMAVAATAARAISFLRSKLPNPPPPTMAEVLSGKGADAAWQPSDAEAHVFDLYYRAVTDPLSILRSARDGRLTQHEIEAVKTVYPRLFAEMQSAALREIAAAEGKVPPQSLRSLEMLLGRDLHGRGNNHLVFTARQQANAAKMAPPQGAPAGGPSPKKHGSMLADSAKRFALRPDSK